MLRIEKILVAHPKLYQVSSLIMIIIHRIFNEQVLVKSYVELQQIQAKHCLEDLTIAE
jgi:hypothetical protein